MRSIPDMSIRHKRSPHSMAALRGGHPGGWAHRWSFVTVHGRVKPTAVRFDFMPPPLFPRTAPALGRSGAFTCVRVGKIPDLRAQEGALVRENSGRDSVSQPGYRTEMSRQSSAVWLRVQWRTGQQWVKPGHGVWWGGASLHESPP